MTPSIVRSSRWLAAVAALTLLAGCSTTVSGTGRPLRVGTSAGGSSSSSGSNGSGGSSSSASPSATGTLDADGDAHDVWAKVVSASTGTGGSVNVGGVISGAGIGKAKITAAYATGDDGQPVAKVGIDTPGGGHLDIVAVGGSAWAKAPASVYVESGYPADASAQAAGKEVVITDDDSGLDVYTSLETFLSICGPDDDEPASVDTGTYQDKPAVIVSDDQYDTKNYVDPDTSLIQASVFQDETVTFTYTDDVTTAVPPAASEIVSVDGF